MVKGEAGSAFLRPFKALSSRAFNGLTLGFEGSEDVAKICMVIMGWLSLLSLTSMTSLVDWVGPRRSMP